MNLFELIKMMVHYEFLEDYGEISGDEALALYDKLSAVNCPLVDLWRNSNEAPILDILASMSIDEVAAIAKELENAK